jgi:hypothetical protein
MTDSAKASEGQPEGFSHDGMRERLWKRAIEPSGVIDVRYAQQKYFRIMRWLGERTALLDYLRSRYGIEETLAQGEHLFAAQDPSGRPMNIFSTTIESFPAAAQAEAAATDAALDPTGRGERPSGLAEVLAAHSSMPGGEPEASPETRFRIRRRPPATVPKSDVLSPDRQPRTAVSDQPARGEQVPDRAAPEFVFRKRVREGPEAQEAVENESTTVQQTRAGGTAGSEFPLTRPLAAPISAAPASALPTSAAPRLAPPPSPMAHSPVAPSPMAHSPKAPDHRVSIARGLNETAALPLPLVKASAAPLNAESRFASGRTQTARESPSAEMGPRRHTGSTSSSHPLAVVAPEIRDDSSNLPRPKIVWRKPPGASSAAYFQAQVSGATSPAVPGQFSHAASAPAAQEGRQNAPPAPPQTQSERAGAEHLSPHTIRAISERVMRAITLDLKLERERRGIMKWR